MAKAPSAAQIAARKAAGERLRAMHAARAQGKQKKKTLKQKTKKRTRKKAAKLRFLKIPERAIRPKPVKRKKSVPAGRAPAPPPPRNGTPEYFKWLRQQQELKNPRRRYPVDENLREQKLYEAQQRREAKKKKTRKKPSAAQLRARAAGAARLRSMRQFKSKVAQRPSYALPVYGDEVVGGQVREAAPWDRPPPPARGRNQPFEKFELNLDPRRNQQQDEMLRDVQKFRVNRSINRQVLRGRNENKDHMTGPGRFPKPLTPLW